MRTALMNTVIWIDLDEAARLLSTGRDKVMCLIREGLLDSKRRRYTGIVLRADEVEGLAEAFNLRKPRRRRAVAQRIAPTLSEPAHCCLGRRDRGPEGLLGCAAS
jgi:hypothetical protein